MAKIIEKIKKIIEKYKNLFFYLIIFVLVFFVIFIVNKKFKSPSKGDIYYAHLNSWYFYAEKSNWQKADQIQKKLDPNDTIFYRSKHDPRELQKNIEKIMLKSSRTVEDWLELAKIQSVLGQKQDAFNSLAQAKKLDPVRSDIEKIYFSVSQ